MVIDINNGIMISKSIKRCFSTTLRLRKIVPSNVKGSSSNHWITRQQNDPYVEKAKMLNYRSAFKLIEMDDKYHFLQPGHTVVDLGAAPGSWTQVAVSRVNANCLDSNKLVGKVVAVDKQQVYPIDETPLQLNISFVGHKLGPSAGITADMKGGLNYYLIRDYAILRWDTSKPLQAEYHDVIAQSYESLPYVPHLFHGPQSGIWALVDPTLPVTCDFKNKTSFTMPEEMPSLKTRVIKLLQYNKNN